MLKEIHKDEFEIAECLVKDGFASAKETLQKILQIPIAIQRIENKDWAIEQLTLNNASPLYILKTELRGEIEGACHLILNTDDVEKIVTSCMPQVPFELEGSHEFLKEIDNMVAGSMVTQFADYLGIFMYGDVPQLIEMDNLKIEKFLKNELSLYDSIIHYKAVLNGPTLSIAPHFVWMFNSTLLDCIKGLTIK